MTNAQTAPVISLVKTSSIDDVFFALRTPYLGTRIEVTDEHGLVFELMINSLLHEDGSGRSLVIAGYARRLIRTSKLGSHKFEAYLNYKGGDRKGWIKILD